MNPLTKSWRTTLAGAGVFLTALGAALSAQFDGDPATIPMWGMVMTAAIMAIGLIVSRDSNVSSEAAGAK